MARRRVQKGRGQPGPRGSAVRSARKFPRWALLVLLFGVAGAILLAIPPPAPGSAWPQDRGPVSARDLSTEVRDNMTVTRVSYVSQGGEARAVLWVPNRTNDTRTRLPALVHMTGMGVPADGAESLARFLGSLGVATLSVEKRGPPSLWVWDLLRGFDLLGSRPEVDPQRVAVSGDSIGANMAIVAAAAEPRLKGALAFSAFPDSRFGPDLDPGQAVGKISPRPVVLFYALGDEATFVEGGRALFRQAGEPRFSHEFNGSCHGHCPAMFPALEAEVRRLFPAAETIQ